MNKKNIPYLTAGLCFAAGCSWLAVPGPSKLIATLFFIAALNSKK